jgi:polysaccharide deacetylase family protein (PEP-CTERM system associated)
MVNAMTVDLEDWYHSIDSIPVSDWGKYETRVSEGTQKLLEMFHQFNLKATFFVLGDVAAKHPALISSIQSAGHEIATHGYAHRLVYRQTPHEFREDLRRSIGVIEEIIQDKVWGYRAPYWTITKESYWALDILLEEGIRYDSSIYPIKTYLYGIPDAPVYPYVIQGTTGAELLEFPPSTVTICGMRIPVAGGFYLRALPSWFIRYGMKRINKDAQPAMVYIHPPEFDSLKPKIKLPMAETILHYYNLGVVEAKLEALLSEFAFDSIRGILWENGASSILQKQVSLGPQDPVPCK